MSRQWQGSELCATPHNSVILLASQRLVKTHTHNNNLIPLPTGSYSVHKDGASNRELAKIAREEYEYIQGFFHMGVNKKGFKGIGVSFLAINI